MAFGKWEKRITKAEMPEDEWDELIVITPGKTLGKTVLEQFLQQDGDLIEIDLAEKDRRAIGNFIKALNVAKGSQKIDFLLRYSRDHKRAYIRRVG